MHIKHREIDIPENNPFANCKLDRKKYGEVLTQIVESCDPGFVLAINNEWGTGKTTFVKMWRQMLVTKGFNTLYFNAWENDFDLNPLTAILAELKKILPEDKSQKFNSLLNKGAIVAQNVLPAIAKGIVKKYIDIPEFNEGIDGTAKAATEILKDEIKRYTARQKGLLDFRKELETYVSSATNLKPLIFIIDELDRCRPNYAVELLEQMKHFFTVNGIIFILSIDKIQLGNAVKGVYGSEDINASEYLRRFIDIEYSIPQPSTISFCNYLISYYKFGDFFGSIKRNQVYDFRQDETSLTAFSAALFSKFNLTLRQQDKILSHSRIALQSFNVNAFVFPSAFILLIYIYLFQNGLYTKILNRQLTLQQFAKEIEVFIPDSNQDVRDRFISHTELLLIYFYYNFLVEKQPSIKLVDENINNTKKLAIAIRYDEVYALDMISRYERSDFHYITINHLLSRISLIENLH